MLRASIVDSSSANPRAALLEELVTAVTGDDAERAAAARTAVVGELGPAWLVDTCAVIANFEMMTRLADGTGARLRPQQLGAAAEIIDELGLRSFASARE